jgi:putative thioredoxin
MDIDKHPAIPGQMGIQSIPAVSRRQPASRPMASSAQCRGPGRPDFIARITKDKLGGRGRISSSPPRGAGGRQCRRGHCRCTAKCCARSRASVPALAGLARAHVESGALDQAQETLALVPRQSATTPTVAAARSALEVAEQATIRRARSARL